VVLRGRVTYGREGADEHGRPQFRSGVEFIETTVASADETLSTIVDAIEARGRPDAGGDPA
jgi:hypothetical protein